MRDTPYGYDIIGGKAVVNSEKAAKILKICDNYLSGMSFVDAAADVGMVKKHCQVKRMIQNRRLTGDDFYPAILTEDMARRIEEERSRRAKAMGRDHLSHKRVEKISVQKDFFIPRIPEKYKNPIRQAEFAYSLIRREVRE